MSRQERDRFYTMVPKYLGNNRICQNPQKLLRCQRKTAIFNISPPPNTRAFGCIASAPNAHLPTPRASPHSHTGQRPGSLHESARPHALAPHIGLRGTGGHILTPVLPGADDCSPRGPRCVVCHHLHFCAGTVNPNLRGEEMGRPSPCVLTPDTCTNLARPNAQRFGHWIGLCCRSAQNLLGGRPPFTPAGFGPAAIAQILIRADPATLVAAAW